jgi:hypothetical protein
MLQVYLWIDGSNFDPDEFHRTVGSKLGGSVVSTKRMRDGSVQPGPKFWRSRVVPVVSQDPENQLHELLVQMKPELTNLKNVSGMRLGAEVVEEVDEMDALRGFFFPRETIELLAEMGLGLDIDINLVPHRPNDGQ